MTAPDPRTVREIAREYVLNDRHRAHDIGPAVLGRFGPDGLTKSEYHAYCDAVREAIATATIAVSWPDGPFHNDEPTSCPDCHHGIWLHYTGVGTRTGCSLSLCDCGRSQDALPSRYSTNSKQELLNVRQQLKDGPAVADNDRTAVEAAVERFGAFLDAWSTLPDYDDIEGLFAASDGYNRVVDPANRPWWLMLRKSDLLSIRAELTRLGPDEQQPADDDWREAVEVVRDWIADLDDEALVQFKVRKVRAILNRPHGLEQPPTVRPWASGEELPSPDLTPEESAAFDAALASCREDPQADEIQRLRAEVRQLEQERTVVPGLEIGTRHLAHAYSAGWYAALDAHRTPGFTEREAGWSEYRKALLTPVADRADRDAGAADLAERDGREAGA